MSLQCLVKWQLFTVVISGVYLAVYSSGMAYAGQGGSKVSHPPKVVKPIDHSASIKALEDCKVENKNTQLLPSFTDEEKLVDRIKQSGPNSVGSFQALQESILKHFPDRNFAMASELDPRTTKFVEVNDPPGTIPLSFGEEDTEYGIMQKRIIDNIGINDLKRNQPYTFIFSQDGGVSFGEIHDALEYGAKHINIARGRKVLVAGEVYYDQNGELYYNILSGTFTYAIARKGSMSLDRLNQATREIFEDQIGKGKVHDDGSVSRFPKTRPNAEELNRLCNYPIFAKYNSSLCSHSIVVNKPKEKNESKNALDNVGDLIDIVEEHRLPGFRNIRSSSAEDFLMGAVPGAYILKPKSLPNGKFILGVSYKAKNGTVVHDVLNSHPSDKVGILKEIEGMKNRGILRNPYFRPIH